MVAASIANMEVGRPEIKGANLHNKSIPDAAEKLNVSERQVSPFQFSIGFVFLGIF
mgnify:CR=1 FL=1